MCTRNYLLFIFFLALASCSTSFKLAVPDIFKQQATMHHVMGARGNKMSFSNYKTSKIKRGLHLSYPGWSRGFLLENLVLNRFGIQKNESVKNERAKFSFTISNGSHAVEVFGREREITRSIEYNSKRVPGVFSGFEQLQNYEYVFAAEIKKGSNDPWELVMSNFYNRNQDTSKPPFPIIRPDESGMATNGKDTLRIKPINTRQTVNDKGKTGSFPITMLTGYEINTREGVMAVIDLVGRNVWVYNELNENDQIIVAAITTALFARRVSGATW